MESEARFWALIWTLVAVLLLAGMAFGFMYCDAVDRRIVECVKAGRSPAECKAGLRA